MSGVRGIHAVRRLASPHAKALQILGEHGFRLYSGDGTQAFGVLVVVEDQAVGGFLAGWEYWYWDGPLPDTFRAQRRWERDLQTSTWKNLVTQASDVPYWTDAQSVKHVAVPGQQDVLDAWSNLSPSQGQTEDWVVAKVVNQVSTDVARIAVDWANPTDKVDWLALQGGPAKLMVTDLTPTNGWLQFTRI